MCVVCLDWEKGKLTNGEALKALGELIQGANEKEKAHYFEVSEKVMDAELPTSASDPELDQKWHEETHGDDGT